MIVLTNQGCFRSASEQILDGKDHFFGDIFLIAATLCCIGHRGCFRGSKEDFQGVFLKNQNWRHFPFTLKCTLQPAVGKKEGCIFEGTASLIRHD